MLILQRVIFYKQLFTIEPIMCPCIIAPPFSERMVKCSYPEHHLFIFRFVPIDNFIEFLLSCPP